MSREILSRPAPEPDDQLTWGPLPDQVADLFLGSPESPLVIAIHGGFWRPAFDRTHLRHVGRALADLGYSTVLPEYRRIPGQPDVMTDDVRVALHVLGTTVHGYFNGRAVLLGHSAGGHLALWASAVCPPYGFAGTCALAPVADLRAADEANLGSGAVRDFLGTAATERPDLDPAELSAPQGRITLILGGRDDVVPAHVSSSYAHVHPAVDVQVVEEADHFDLIDPTSSSWHVITQALERLRVSS
jgi:acetyl esterase/lipase